MKLLISDKEIAEYLFSLIDFKSLLFPNNDYSFNTLETDQIIDFTKQEITHPRFNLTKKRTKIKNKIYNAVEKDLQDFVDITKKRIKSKRKNLKLLINNNLDNILNHLGEDKVLKEYKNSSYTNFVKTVGLQIDSNAKLERVKKYKISSDSFLIRNTNVNENLLVHRVKSKLPFWFIDSGYTNFVETHKKWHRLVINHLHYGKFFDAPVDRLSSFKIFPKPWRTGGHAIMIIEPGPFSAAIFGVDVPQWKKSVEIELRKYTDKPIVFREKINKKIRKNLYQELCDEDYYCVINLNSNAATESLWAGVPAITLDCHITNSVTRNKISDINNLLRPNLASWLSMLSYSQFTYDELMNGTAYEIIKKYHV